MTDYVNITSPRIARFMREITGSRMPAASSIGSSPPAQSSPPDLASMSAAHDGAEVLGSRNRADNTPRSRAL